MSPFDDAASSPDVSLAPREVFVAMIDTWQFAKRAGNDLLGLIGDISLRPDGGPMDPVVWTDRMDHVREVKDPSYRQS